MDEDNDIWGDDEDIAWFNTPPELRKATNQVQNAPESTLPIKQEVNEEDADIWGTDEDEMFLCSASQMVEDRCMNMLAGGASNSNVPSSSTSPTSVEPSRVLAILKLMEEKKNDTSKDDQHPWDFRGDERLNTTAKNHNSELQGENIDEFRNEYYALLGENSTLRRKMDSSIQAKDKHTSERLAKEMEEKQRDKEKLRKAEEEKENLKSQLASQRMEMFRLECNSRFKNRDSSTCHSQSNQSHADSSVATKFPNVKSFLSKEIPPVPKFESPEPSRSATPTRSSATPSVRKRLMQMLGKVEEKPKAEETETRDFRLIKPATLADYETDEYVWHRPIISCDDSGDINGECFINNTKPKEEPMEADDSFDSSDSSSVASNDGVNDWEGVLYQNPAPPVPPEELILTSVNDVVQWLKLDPRENQNSSTAIPETKEDTNKEEVEQKRLSDVENKLASFITSHTLWSQIFVYIQKCVENRYEPLRQLVADVSRLALHAIGELENLPRRVSSELVYPKDERRLWKWYLDDIDRKQPDASRRNLRTPSFMPSNCESGPSMKFITLIGSLANEPLTAWCVLSHVRVQLEDLIWISNRSNEWRIYEKSHLETFLKLLMWTSELWPHVLEEEKSPEIVQFHLPHWQTELKSWTSIVLDVGNAQYLFSGKLQKTIVCLTLDILTKIMKAGYFHTTTENYQALSEILQLTCELFKHGSFDSDVLMNVCTILKYGFKDHQFMNLLCGGVNENRCLLYIISRCFLRIHVTEIKPYMKAKLFCEYVSTIDLLKQRHPPVYYSSLLARANLIQKRTNTIIDEYPNEEVPTDITYGEVWLHPSNWEDPDNTKNLCHCRKVLCGDVILMFSKIIPLWREAVNEAESELLALEKQHKIEDAEFLEQHETDKNRISNDFQEKKQLDQLRNIYLKQFMEYKRCDPIFSNLELQFTPHEKDVEKVKKYLNDLPIYNQKLMQYKEKKATLIGRRREYKINIMKQGLLDEEVFSNWTQVGKLLRQRLGKDLPWWLKIYEREQTIFDKALEIGMVFIHQFWNTPNMMATVGEVGLRDFLTVLPILKAYSEEFLINNDKASTIRELTSFPTQNMAEQNTSRDFSSSSLSDPVKMSHKIINKGGCIGVVLKEVKFEDEHLPDLKQSDINRLKVLVEKDVIKPISLRPLRNTREKNRIIATDTVIWMRERLKLKSIEELTTPTGSLSNALFGSKRFSLPYRKVNNINEGSRYLNNCEDTINPRHKRDKVLAEKDEGCPYDVFGVISINNTNTETEYFENGDNPGPSESVSVSEDPEEDKRDWNMFLPTTSKQ